MNNREPTREQFEQFLQEIAPDSNIIAGSGETRITAKDGTTTCDFCGTQPAPHIHEAIDITLMSDDTFGDHVSAGNWGACEACHSLILAGDRRGLTEHATRHDDRARSGVSRRNGAPLYRQYACVVLGCA